MQIDIPSALAGVILGLAIMVILIFVDWWMVILITLLAATAIGAVAALRVRASNISARREESESV